MGTSLVSGSDAAGEHAERSSESSTPHHHPPHQSARARGAAVGAALGQGWDFSHLWAASAISQVGSQFTLLIFPLLAATMLNASPIAVGVLGAVGALPHLLFGFVAGAWVDRLRRRPILIAADIGRCVLLLSVALVAFTDALSVGFLVAAAFLIESCTVFFDLAYVAYVPGLVPHDRLVGANSRLEVSASASQIVGPAFGGAAIRLLGAPIALLFDAISYLVSAALLSRIRAEETAPARVEDSHIVAEIREGLAFLWSNRVLRGLALANGLVSLGGYIFLAVYILYLVRELHLDPGAIGLILATGGAGALAGALAAAPAKRRWGTARVLVGSLVLFGVGGLTVPLAVLFPGVALPMIVASEVLQWFAILVFSVNAVTVRQSISPPLMLGRINGSMRVLTFGLRTVASLLGGLLGSRIGLPATLVVGAFGMLISFLPLLNAGVADLDRAEPPVTALRLPPAP
ncbi:MAG: MFS transporter [Thermomicrobiales bacterium]|nr:MFS transporter [Thermomicrobiales bacterium]